MISNSATIRGGSGPEVFRLVVDVCVVYGLGLSRLVSDTKVMTARQVTS